MCFFNMLSISLIFLLSCAWVAAADTPHIVFVLADDLGFHDVPWTWTGSKVRTPAMYALVQDGIVLSNSYVNPICTPTRTSLMSSRYPLEVGRQDGVILDTWPTGLMLNMTLIPQRLKAAGYETKMVGKWHLGFYKTEYTPYARGFDEWVGYYTGNLAYGSDIPVLAEAGAGTHYGDLGHTSAAWHAGNYTARDFSHGWASNMSHVPISNTTDNIYSTNYFSDQAVKWIQDHNTSKPLFLYLPFEAVHGASNCAPDCYDPVGDLLMAPDFFTDQQDPSLNKFRRMYGGMVGALDSAIANITAALKAKEMWENTLFIFENDNGAPSPHFSAQAMSNWPLCGNKGNTWEGGVRGAAFVAGGWNGIKQRGANSTALTHVTDWYPTLVGIVGGNAKGGPGTGLPYLLSPNETPPPGVTDVEHVSGYAMMDVFNGEGTNPRDEVVHNIDSRGVGALRLGRYKVNVGSGHGEYFPNPDDPASVVATIPKDATALGEVWDPAAIGSSWEELKPLSPHTSVWLYDIEGGDVAETINLAQSNPSVLNQTMARYAYWKTRSVPADTPSPDPDANPYTNGNNGVWAPWRDE